MSYSIIIDSFDRQELVHPRGDMTYWVKINIIKFCNRLKPQMKQYPHIPQSAFDNLTIMNLPDFRLIKLVFSKVENNIVEFTPAIHANSRFFHGEIDIKSTTVDELVFQYWEEEKEFHKLLDIHNIIC